MVSKQQLKEHNFMRASNMVAQCKNFYSPAYEASRVVLQKDQVNAFSWSLPI